MVAKVFKKIGMAILYYFIATLFSTLFDMFGFYVARGVFFALVQIIGLGTILCSISRYLRIAKLKKEHKGDESEEKRIFNSDIKSKIKFIVKSADFKIEAVLFVLASLIIFVNPALGGAVIIGFSGTAYAIMFIISVILSAVYMSLLDITAWIMAYNRCYKRREY